MFKNVGLLGFFSLVFILTIIFTSRTDILFAQNVPPPMPIEFSGTVLVAGSPADAGLQIVAEVPSRNYVSEPVTLTDGGVYSAYELLLKLEIYLMMGTVLCLNSSTLKLLLLKQLNLSRQM